MGFLRRISRTNRNGALAVTRPPLAGPREAKYDGREKDVVHYPAAGFRGLWQGQGNILMMFVLSIVALFYYITLVSEIDGGYRRPRRGNC